MKKQPGAELVQWMDAKEVVALAKEAFADAYVLCSPPAGEKFIERDGTWWVGTEDWTQWLVEVFRARVELKYIENFDREPYTGSAVDQGALRGFVTNGGKW
jgi:hypothetical protein